MRTRTRLTTAPGEEPAPPPSLGGTSTGSSSETERYVPAFELPSEPSPPSRYRRLLVVASVLVVLVVAAYAVLQVVTAGEDFDPAVGDNPGAPTQPDAGSGS